MALKVADLYCGAGGFSHGFEKNGKFKVVLGIDIDDMRVQTFAANHRGALGICADIRQIHVRDLAERLGTGPGGLDAVIAGPPCQGFSSIRPFRSINEDDQRNSLFEQLLVFVEFFRPRVVVFENVVGLLHHHGGQILKAIMASFESLGYAPASQVLNAVHFGVPQRRERVFVIACRGRIPPEFPKPSHQFDGRSMAPTVSSLFELPLFAGDLPPAITVADAICDLPPLEAGESSELYLDDMGTAYTRARRKGQTVLTLHSATRHTQRMLEIIRLSGTNRWALPLGSTTSGFSSCYSRLRADEPSTTVTVNFVHPASNRCIHPSQNRALTAREGARLQSFDDDFHFLGSRTQIVKQIGEAVPPILGGVIANSLLDYF